VANVTTWRHATPF